MFLLLGVALLLVLAIFVPRTAGRPQKLSELLRTKSIHSFGLAVPAEGTQFLLSVILLGAGLYVILSKQYDASDKHWAYGIVGTLVGFWLRPLRATKERQKSN